MKAILVDLKMNWSIGKNAERSFHKSLPTSVGKKYVISGFIIILLNLFSFKHIFKAKFILIVL